MIANVKIFTMIYF